MRLTRLSALVAPDKMVKLTQGGYAVDITPQEETPEVVEVTEPGPIKRGKIVLITGSASRVTLDKSLSGQLTLKVLRTGGTYLDAGGVLIDGQRQVTLSQYDGITLLKHKDAWYVMGRT